MEEREKMVKIYLNRRERREEREKNFRERERERERERDKIEEREGIHHFYNLIK